MKSVVFGASRGVGLEVVRQGLEAGHRVTAFVRSPEKLEVRHLNLPVFKGDSMDTLLLLQKEALAGQARWSARWLQRDRQFHICI